VRCGLVFLEPVRASVILGHIITVNWHALAAGIPVVDAVNDGTCPPPVKVQRRVSRLQDGNGAGGPACNIGAFDANGSSF